VLIRARKPWFFARRRLLGWNVRFMIWLLAREVRLNLFRAEVNLTVGGVEGSNQRPAPPGKLQGPAAGAAGEATCDRAAGMARVTTPVHTCG
jgi:hypothetical protein